MFGKFIYFQFNLLRYPVDDFVFRHRSLLLGAMTLGRSAAPLVAHGNGWRYPSLLEQVVSKRQRIDKQFPATWRAILW